MSSAIAYSFEPGLQEDTGAFLRQIFGALEAARGIPFRELSRDLDSSGGEDTVRFSASSSLQNSFQILSSVLATTDREREAATLQYVLELCETDVQLGGLGLETSSQSSPWSLSAKDLNDIIFLAEAWLEALNSADKNSPLPAPVATKSAERRPMTLSEKIFVHHTARVPSAAGVKPGDLIRVSVDWVIASELSWVGMKHSLASIGQTPTVWRNDRFWLAGDHVVDPRTYEQPRVRELMEGMEQAKKSFKMTENQGSNYTILHTEFVRERAEPGMIVIGSDSHSCSAGAVSCLGIGLGAADVMLALATGETWFKIPECINVRLVGQPAWYIRGKDTILYILKELKRNTAAADRIVEFTGSGAQYLSCDARFAITNMCTELGGITGVFAPDQVTHDYIKARPRQANKSTSLYFQPDEGAQYAATFEIDLSQVTSFLALYPSPDNVVPVREKLGMKFDGCFIGACTTTEEELILAALILQVGLQKNLRLAPGKRQVVPGSLPIVRKLTELGLLEVYEDAGFTRAAPGCSLCLGMGADRADPGETWLSSQNRNFKNRMGQGSFGNICSAATVAASSFSMTLTDPRPFLAEVDHELYNSLLKTCQKPRKTKQAAISTEHAPSLQFLEPHISHGLPSQMASATTTPENSPAAAVIKSKAYALGDFVDTDAIIPASFILASPTDKDLGSHCLEYTNPDFREKVRAGFDIVVAGKAFGCGSSREEAPRALKGLGVKCVIAKSFSFIYGRNQPTIALLGINITDEDFYTRAVTGAEIEVNISRRAVVVEQIEYPFVLDEMELRLIESRGLAAAYSKFGKSVFQSLCGERKEEVKSEAWANKLEENEREIARNELSW